MRMAALAMAMLLLAGAAEALADPPGRVGRLSFSDGPVWHRPAERNEWIAAPVNYPVTSGMSLRTAPSTRAEIQIGPVEVHIDHRTTLDVPRLDDEQSVLRLVDGTIGVRLRESAAGMQVETSRGTVRLLRPGRYRIDLRSSGDAAAQLGIAVFEGEASFAGPGAAVELNESEAVQIAGEPAQISFVAAIVTPFDGWAMERGRMVSPLAGQYVSPDVTGWQDLDAHGEWQVEPDYGAIWYPRVLPAGWAPYRHGHWAYISPWGWTWIDESPWGFAPFHYGRWVHVGNRWAWCPGRLRARPVYAPALVVFIGRGGPHHDARHHHSAIGWVPLGAHEHYRPHYRASAAYVQRINLTVREDTRRAGRVGGKPERSSAITGLTHHRAATVVTQETFVRSAPVHRARRPGGEAQFAATAAARDIGALQPPATARAKAPDRSDTRPSPAAKPTDWKERAEERARRDGGRANRPAVAVGPERARHASGAPPPPSAAAPAGAPSSSVRRGTAAASGAADRNAERVTGRTVAAPAAAPSSPLGRRELDRPLARPPVPRATVPSGVIGPATSPMKAAPLPVDRKLDSAPRHVPAPPARPAPPAVSRKSEQPSAKRPERVAPRLASPVARPELAHPAPSPIQRPTAPVRRQETRPPQIRMSPPRPPAAENTRARKESRSLPSSGERGASGRRP